MGIHHELSNTQLKQRIIEEYNQNPEEYDDVCQALAWELYDRVCTGQIKLED